MLKKNKSEKKAPKKKRSFFHKNKKKEEITNSDNQELEEFHPQYISEDLDIEPKTKVNKVEESKVEDEEDTDKKKEVKKKRKPLSLKATYTICAIVFAISSLMVYYFSSDSKVRVLACSGNYYYTDAQIYDMANISKETRLWLVPSSLMESRIDNNGLIKSVSIKKSNGKLILKVQEKFPIGYYVEDGKNYILTIDGESIEVEDEYKENLIHLPLISSGFDEEQRKEICSALKEKKDKLTHDVIEKISEIVPFESSYDKNMVRFIMRDGNNVYSSMDSLTMITKYSQVLTQLKGTSACLVLDAAHSAVDKINCEDVTTQRKAQEEEQTACEEKEGTWDSSTGTCIEKEEETDEEADESETSDDSDIISYLQTIEDWEYDETTGLYISATADYYYDPTSGTYYTWDETTGSFQELTATTSDEG